MAVRNSAGSRIHWTRVHSRTRCQIFLSVFSPCNNACDAGNVAVRVSLTSTGYSHRVEAGGVDHRLPWQPEGKPFHPAGGISCQGRVKQPENPSLHPLFLLSFRILWLPFSPSLQPDCPHTFHPP